MSVIGWLPTIFTMAHMKQSDDLKARAQAKGKKRAAEEVHATCEA